MPSLTTAEASDLFRADPHEWIDVGAGDVALRTVGTGPDVLFVHGWPLSGATFRQVLPHLVDHVTCHVIDLPSAGSSRFDDATPISIEQHITTVRRVVDHLGTGSIALVGHDSGGLISRHAMCGDPRLRSLGLINTEPPSPGWRFTSFIRGAKMPGFGPFFGWVAGQPGIRRNKFLLGDAFADKSLLDGDFDEFFLEPLHQNAAMRNAAMRAVKSFSLKDHVATLSSIHAKINVPVQLVWGAHDPFFPVARARAMLDELANARLEVIPDAGLFSHEEAPAAVSQALLPALTGEWAASSVSQPD